MVDLDVTMTRGAGPLGPLQASPVQRPTLVQPHDTVDLPDGDEGVTVRMHLLHAANYNDPAPFPAVGWSRSTR